MNYAPDYAALRRALHSDNMYVGTSAAGYEMHLMKTSGLVPMYMLTIPDEWGWIEGANTEGVFAELWDKMCQMSVTPPVLAKRGGK